MYPTGRVGSCPSAQRTQAVRNLGACQAGICFRQVRRSRQMTHQSAVAGDVGDDGGIELRRRRDHRPVRLRGHKSGFSANTGFSASTKYERQCRDHWPTGPHISAQPPYEFQRRDSEREGGITRGDGRSESSLSDLQRHGAAAAPVHVHFKSPKCARACALHLLR